MVLFTSDVDRRWNDFPLNQAFVPFVIEAVRHAAALTELPGEYAIADVPSGGRPEPGVQTLGDGRRITVNVDPRESAIASLTPAEFKAGLAAVSGPAAALPGRRWNARRGKPKARRTSGGMGCC